MTKILVDKLVLEQALEALEADNSKLWPSDRRTAAYFNLRAAMAETVQESVKLPTTAAVAEMMVKAGLMWLEQNAPDRLLKPAQEPAQEPVAYIHRQGNHFEVSERHLDEDEKARGWTEEPLYTAPSQLGKGVVK